MKKIIVIMLLHLLLFGCTHHPVPVSVPVLTPDGAWGGKTPVFFRFVAEEGKPSCFDNLQSWLTSYILGLRSLDTDKLIPIEEALYSLPVEMAGSDWVALLLDSGNYNLAFTLWDGKSYKENKFLLGVPVIPAGGVYAGTFILDCEKRAGHNYYLLSAVGIVDESAEANRIINTFLGREPHASCIVSPYGQQLQGDKNLPTAVAVSFGEKLPLQTPTLKERAIKNALGRGGEVKYELRKDTDSASPLQQGIGILMETPAGIFIAMGYLAGYLAYSPFGATYGYMKGGLDEKKYGGCMQELGQEAARLDLKSMVQRFLGESLPLGTTIVFDGDPLQTATTSMSGQVARIEFRRLKLRECLGEMSYCVEVMALAQVWDESEKRYVFDETLVYRHPFALFEAPPPTYEIEIEPKAGCRPISIYCGDSGKEILREELTRGVEQLVLRALRDFGFQVNSRQNSQEPIDKGSIPHNDSEIR